eukprot:TRINITY_DN13449_c0_g1_i3.p1 TRINITY_DN13449_c0_g1~~TRINITY_DN13449_c0_g1_i3.p1  ORF type:complete len:392 (+),score=90.65 TRINITY_DN13449_c0_g1_i3:33-1178(+)
MGDKGYDAALCRAAKYGHVAIVDRLLQSIKATPFHAQPFGADIVTMISSIALDEAAKHNQVRVVDRLLTEFAEADIAIYKSALFEAASFGHVAVVDRLLAVPALDAIAQGHSALRKAASRGHVAVAQRLLAMYDGNATVQYSNAFREACQNGHVAVIDCLLAVPGVDATANNNEALIQAAANGHLAVVNRLLAVPGVDVTAQDNAAIYNAVVHRQNDIVDRLLAVPGINAERAIRAAIARKSWDAVEILLMNRAAAESVGLEQVAAQCAIARHCKAIQLCGCKKLNVRKPYELGFWVVKAAETERERQTRGLPVGVSELICEYLVGSRGLAMWVMSVQRKLKNLLQQLKSVTKIVRVKRHSITSSFSDLGPSKKSRLMLSD